MSEIENGVCGGEGVGYVEEILDICNETCLMDGPHLCMQTWLERAIKPLLDRRPVWLA